MANAKTKTKSKKRSGRPKATVPRWDDGKLACEGFQIAADPSLSSREAALAVKSAIARVLGAPDMWRAVRMSRERHEFTLTRAHGRRSISARTAFDQARSLALQPGIVASEPALIVPSGVRPGPTPGVAFKAIVQPSARGKGVKAASAATAEDCEWSVKQVHAKAAWALSPPDRAQGAGIVIGHPDTGYTHHPEIWADDGQDNRVLFDRGHDFVASDGDPLDELEGSLYTLEFPGHGTATASVLMSDEFGPDRAQFVTGVAPRATLVPFRVSTSVIHLSFTNLTAAIYAAVDAGCHVVSMSLGGPIPSGALERAIQYAVSQGVILLAAAGNYWPWVTWPAAYGEVVAVAACNAGETMWRWSATGPAVEITGPGEDVWVARSVKAGPAPYTVNQSSGTSFAVAHVAGAAALWLAHHGRDALIARHGAANLSSVFRSTLRQTVRTPNGWRDLEWGAGILDAAALLAVDALAIAPKGAPTAKTAAVGVGPAPAELEAFLAKLRIYFPGASEAGLRALPTLLLGNDGDLAENIRTFGQELLVHMGMDPAFRSRVEQQIGSVGAKTTRRRATVHAPSIVAPKGASLGLTRRLHDGSRPPSA